MGYLFLSISLLSGATKGYCGKRLGGFAANTQSAVLLNLIRMVLCVLLGVAVSLATGSLRFSAPLPAIGLCALSGVGTAIFVVSWLLAVKKSAYMLVDTFLMLGTLVPMVLGYVLFSEPISLRQWFGFALLVTATLVLCSYNNDLKVKLTAAGIGLLLLCGLANGITDFSQKLFVKTFPEISISLFTLYTYLFAAAALGIFFLAVSGKEKPRFEDNAPRLKYLYVVIMAVALTANSYFKTLAAIYLSSAQLYPLNQGLSMALATLMATFFFKEKFTGKTLIGIVLTFISLLIINL